MQRRQCLLAVAVAGGLAGCSGDTGTPTETDSIPKTATEAEQETPTETPEATSTSVPKPEIRKTIVIDESGYEDGIEATEVEQTELGARLGVAVEFAVPAVDGIYEATLRAEFRTADGEVVDEYKVLPADTAEKGPVVLERVTLFETTELSGGEYEVKVTLRDDATGTEVTTIVGPVRIVDPKAEEKQQVEDALTKVREIVNEALGIYRDRGNGDLTGVGAEDTDVDLGAVIEALLEAAEPLRTAADADVQGYGEQIKRHRAEVNLVKNIVYTQRTIWDTRSISEELYRRLEIESRYRSDSLETYSEKVTDVKSRRDTLGSLFETVTSSGDPQADYQPKLGQFGAEHGVLKLYEEQANAFIDATRTLDDGRVEYDRGNYNQAQLHAEDALEAFGAIVDALQGVDVATLQVTSDAHAERAQTKADEADQLRRDAIAAQDE